VGFVQASIPQTALCADLVRPPSRQNCSRETLLQHLHHGGRISFLRLAQQQVDMFRHNHVTDHDEMVASPNLFQDFQKQIATTSRGDQWASLVTTRGDEVKISGTVAAPQTLGQVVSVGSPRATAM